MLDAPLDSETKASLWDSFYNAASPADLEARLDNYPRVPNSVKQELVVARAKHDVMVRNAAQPETQSPAHHALMDLYRVAQSAPQAIAWAEKNPSIAKALIDAALFEHKINWQDSTASATWQSLRATRG